MNTPYSEEVMKTFYDWYSCPSNQGVPPENLKYIGEFKRDYLIFDGEQTTGLVSYKKRNGKYGRGFVNPITWSFFVQDDSQINDEDLVTAYCGWTLFYAGVFKGSVKADFQDKDSSTKQIGEKIRAELSDDFQLKMKYVIDDIIYAEFEGTVDGVRAKQAVGNDNSSLYLDEKDPRFVLPALWTLLGHTQQT